MTTMDWKWIAKVVGVSAAVGTAAGVGSWFIFKKLNERKANKALEEYGDVEQWDDEWSDNLEDQIKLIFPDGVNEENGDGDLKSPTTTKPSLSDMIDYTKFYKARKNGTDDAETSEPKETKYVHVISSDEFIKKMGNLDGYVSVTGTWFSDDKILAGWDDKLDVKDVASTIGKEAASLFDDPDTEAVYVQNDLFKVLYEIVRGDGSYKTAKDEVGYSDDEDEG